MTTTIERVFIWGPYDGWAKDGTGDTGFTMAHSMTPSLANPYLFIYKGAELPRKNSIKDKDGNAHPGGLNFKVGPQSAVAILLVQQQMPSEDLMTVALILQRVTTIRNRL